MKIKTQVLTAFFSEKGRMGAEKPKHSSLNIDGIHICYIGIKPYVTIISPIYHPDNATAAFPEMGFLLVKV